MKRIERLREDLRNNANPETKEKTNRFFKEPVQSYGIKTAIVNSLARKYFRLIKEAPKKEIFSLCTNLWQSGYLEESFIACHWSHRIHKQFEPGDFLQFQQWVYNYIDNWASCDSFCNHTLGTFLEMYPDHIKELYTWAKSDNRWVRRASAVSLIVPAKRGLFLQEVFQITDILLLDTDDMVQKGYGWLLKVASQPHETDIFEYVMKHKSNMPRTSLRYAIEKMPKERKQEAMKK